MGELVILERAREAKSDRAALRAPVSFFFDPGHPLCYVAAERIERLCGEIEWIPVALPLPPETDTVAAPVARLYGLPLVWPEEPTAGRLPVLRAAAYAHECGAGARFAVACSRLAFAGGYALDEGVVMEAAGAAGLDPRDVRDAAADASWDEVILEASETVREQGIDQLPAIRLADGRWYAGVDALAWSPVYGGRAHSLAG